MDDASFPARACATTVFPAAVGPTRKQAEQQTLKAPEIPPFSLFHFHAVGDW